MTNLSIKDLTHQPYDVTLAAMQAFTASRLADTSDEIWVVEHPPVFTQGQAGRAEHILDAGDIPVVQSDRGGQVTYHGPGQIVIYLLLDIRRLGIGIKTLVCTLETAIIDFLRLEFGIDSQRKENAPGVYVADAKIASLGLRVKQGCCYHGLALNTDMDLSPFSRINPCGYAGLTVTQIKDCATKGQVANLKTLKIQIIGHLIGKLGYTSAQQQNNCKQ